MNAYAVVGPTNFQPRAFRSLDKAVDTSVVAGMSLGGVRLSGSNDQKYAAKDPNSSANSRARPALLIVASIFPLWRTIPASARSLSMSDCPNSATTDGSKPAKALRKLSRLRRIVSQLKPDWNPSRHTFSNNLMSSP